MIVNHGSVLPTEYFVSFVRLVMTSRDMSIEQAKRYMHKEFFKNNTCRYGADTYSRFLKALQILGGSET
ncbi:hypothetical protein SAMN04488134_11642 [Amphibacillus marinus]|uniref:Uncharacterized protein n=1 Tax=Amphibacillus marinus TaxID=872970 RepID=A0A1H8TI16_9BACI|nr:hypothetical protein [Amphibacillus marinus]SEO90214.1 hypothetical protein SAMN04488134_11642 [Amphibacillus marinus]